VSLVRDLYEMIGDRSFERKPRGRATCAENIYLQPEEWGEGGWGR